MSKKKPNLMPQRMFLAVLRTNLDELPIGIFATRKEARVACWLMTSSRADKLAKLMRVDYAGRVCNAIIEFVNGVPKKLEIVDDWYEHKRGPAPATEARKT